VTHLEKVQAELKRYEHALMDFSAREHKGQKRASGESYLVHPLEVADILELTRREVLREAVRQGQSKFATYSRGLLTVWRRGLRPRLTLIGRSV